MNTPPRVMLLIDADNVSADVIEQAVQRTFAEYGAIHLRRAYCNAETAFRLQPLFKRLSVRPMVNLSAGKNCTDIALAIDAVDLASAERPDIAVLVSSDSDFAPLVMRLREKGCRVCGIGQRGKTGDETIALYDSFIDLQHQPARKAPAKTPAKRATRRAKAAPVEVAVPPAAEVPIERMAREEPWEELSAPLREDLPEAPPEEVLRILDAVAELALGRKMELNVAAERLRAAKLLGKSASSPKLFKKHPGFFRLSPEKTPNKVQYLGALPG